MKDHHSILSNDWSEAAGYIVVETTSSDIYIWEIVDGSLERRLVGSSAARFMNLRGFYAPSTSTPNSTQFDDRSAFGCVSGMSTSLNASVLLVDLVHDSLQSGYSKLQVPINPQLTCAISLLLDWDIDTDLAEIMTDKLGFFDPSRLLRTSSGTLMCSAAFGGILPTAGGTPCNIYHIYQSTYVSKYLQLRFR
jgi:hypothetical protein